MGLQSKLRDFFLNNEHGSLSFDGMPLTLKATLDTTQTLWYKTIFSRSRLHCVIPKKNAPVDQTEGSRHYFICNHGTLRVWPLFSELPLWTQSYLNLFTRKQNIEDYWLKSRQEYLNENVTHALFSKFFKRSLCWHNVDIRGNQIGRGRSEPEKKSPRPFLGSPVHPSLFPLTLSFGSSGKLSPESVQSRTRKISEFCPLISTR